MALKNARKAAILLKALEPLLAAELLRSAAPPMIAEIAAELATLESSGYDPAVDDEVTIEEFTGLMLQGTGDQDGDDSLRVLLEGAVGQQQSVALLTQVDQMVQLRDPFRSIRTTETAKLAMGLKGESAQVVAMVLSELPTRRSAELLEMLDEEIRGPVVSGMANSGEVSLEAKLQVAEAVADRIQEMDEGDTVVIEEPDDSEKEDEVKLRRVALLLRGLSADVRNELLGSITTENEKTGEAVKRLMIVWEDLISIADRTMQEAMRSGDSRKLALALVGASEAVIERIRSNMSARASSMLDEESSLLSKPKAEEINEAREDILNVLREMNSSGELEFRDEDENQ